MLMGLPQVKKCYTPAEYYALERDAAYKSDYYSGEIFDMSGGTSTHSLITANVLVAVGIRLKGKPCIPCESNMRLKIARTGLRTYPDVSVYCAPLQYDPEDPENTTALNPTVVFEVLSPTTESYDRRFKAQHYRQVESLMCYVFVAQDQAYVEVYERQSNGAWSFRDANGLEAVARLDAIQIDLSLADIYDRVELPARLSPPLNGR